MNKFTGDPIGKAILEYVNTNKPDDIIVSSEICEDDIIPLEVLFRQYDEMPELEKLALSLAAGDVLDVGAGAGFHAKYLQDKGFNVQTIDISEGSVQFMISNGLKASKIDLVLGDGKESYVEEVDSSAIPNTEIPVNEQ